MRTPSIAAALILVAGVLALQANEPAAAAGSCKVVNVTLGETYGPGDGALLQQAIDEAQAFNNLVVRGTCVGNFTISSPYLRLRGASTTDYPVGTLDGDASGTVLTVNSGAEVTLANLKVTNGHKVGGGGGIYNDGNLTLTGSTVISGNWAGQGGGIYNAAHGVLIMTDTSSVEGNHAASIGGGVVDYYGVIEMTHDSSVSSNTSDDSVGGIWEYSGKIWMKRTATISGNMDYSQAGGIEVDSGGHLIMRGSSSVEGNSSLHEGGVYVAGAYMKMFGTSSVRNNSGGYGAGIGLFGGRIILYDTSTVTGNTATVHGGGFFVSAGHLVMNGRSTVTANTADSDADATGKGGGIAECSLGVHLRGVTRGVNVYENHLGDDTVSNISSIKC